MSTLRLLSENNYKAICIDAIHFIQAINIGAL